MKQHKFGMFCSGTKIKVKPSPFQRNTQRTSRSKGDEAREVLANTLLNHVPVVRYNFQAKVGRLTICLHSTYESYDSLFLQATTTCTPCSRD